MVGEQVVVEADAIADGHDQIACRLLHAHGDGEWTEVPMRSIGNDTWRAAFGVGQLGVHRYTVAAWVDSFLTWRHSFARRTAPADVAEALLEGADLVRSAAARATAPAKSALLSFADELERPGLARRAPHARAVDRARRAHGGSSRTARSRSVYGPELAVVVERPLARFSTWYEFFPRSAVGAGQRHGTLATAKSRLSVRRGDGLRRAVLAADPPDRRDEAQGC